MKKVQNFAQPTITTTYAGEFAGQYIAAALLSAKTLDNKYVTIHPNVKYKEVIQRIAVANIVNDTSCDFTTSGSVTLTEAVLTPKELQVNLQLCKQNFVQSWEALQLGYSAFDEIPKNFNDYLISYVGGIVAQATEISIWQGNASTNGQFGGFQPALSASIAAATGVIAAKSGSTIISGSITSATSRPACAVASRAPATAARFPTSSRPGPRSRRAGCSRRTRRCRSWSIPAGWPSPRPASRPAPPALRGPPMIRSPISSWNSGTETACGPTSRNRAWTCRRR